MADKNEHNGEHAIRPIVLALYFIGAVLSGGGGTYAWLNTAGPEMVAPDRYTGSQAAALIARVGRIESDISQHITHHPDDVNQFDRRIATLEAQYAIILQNQARILDRLDNMK